MMLRGEVDAEEGERGWSTCSQLVMLVVAYFCGSIPSGFLIIKATTGKDIRQFGSGNIGMANAYRVGGAIPALLVLLGDALKGALPVIIARGALNLPDLAVVLIGLAAIIGHDFPIFLRGQGGKGIATSLGVITALVPPVGIVAVIVWWIVILSTGYASLASLIMLFVATVGAGLLRHGLPLAASPDLHRLSRRPVRRRRLAAPRQYRTPQAGDGVEAARRESGRHAGSSRAGGCGMSAILYRSVLIYGAGAVGQFIGGTLALAGRDVTFLARPTLRDALARSAADDHRRSARPGQATPECHRQSRRSARSAICSARPTSCILAVKGYDTVGALPDLRRLVAAGATVLTVQNGVGHEETLRDALGAAAVRSGALTINVSVAAPGQVVRHTQKGGLGLAPVGHGALGPLPELFQPTLLPIVTAQTHRVLKWSKMLLNILGNAQAALLDCSSGELYADPRLFAVERRAFHEARAVMRAAGIGLVDLPAYPVRALTVAMALPAPLAQRVLAGRLTRGRGSKAPSLALDSARGAWQDRDRLV